MRTIIAFFLAAWMAVWPCYANPWLTVVGKHVPVAPSGFTDAFDGTGAMSGSWNVLSGTMTRVSGAATSTNINGESIALVTSWSPSANQYTEAVIAATTSNGAVTLAGRMVGSGATRDGYQAVFFFGTGASTSSYAVIERVDDGVGTTIATISSGYPSHGDTVRLECNGTTIRALVNGSQVASATSATYSAAGSVGLILYSAASGVGAASSFAAADL